MNTRPSCFARIVAVVLLSSMVTPIFAQSNPTGSSAPQMLRIVILEGEGALNNIKQRTAREPIVKVEDENHRPVAGVLVTFHLPENGPSGVFADGSRALAVRTNAQGLAKANGLRPNSQTGPYQISVVASMESLQAIAVISQSNVSGSGGAGVHSAGFSPKWLIIGAIAAGGAAVAAVAATNGGGGGGGARTVSVTPGTSTVGPPR